MYRIGVDLGGTNIAVGVVDEQYRIAAAAHTPTHPERGAEAVVEDIANCIENALLFSGIELRECDSIGIGSPGSCDREKGVVVQAYNLGWFQVPVCSLLAHYFGLPVSLGNDGDCAALGEVTAGAAKGKKSVLMVTLGTGVGGGIVIDGKICAGYRGLGGEIGHMCIAMDGERCSCGERGCWEAYASASALIRQGEAAAKENPTSALARMGTLDGKKIFDAAQSGDAVAAMVTERYCRYVAIGLTSLTNSLYPEMILLGGGICGQGENLLGPIGRYLAEHCFARGAGTLPELARAALGNDAGIIGAAVLGGMEKRE